MGGRWRSWKYSKKTAKTRNHSGEATPEVPTTNKGNVDGITDEERTHENKEEKGKIHVKDTRSVENAEGNEVTVYRQSQTFRLKQHYVIFALHSCVIVIIVSYCHKTTTHNLNCKIKLKL